MLGILFQLFKKYNYGTRFFPASQNKLFVILFLNNSSKNV
jgi:hypothetical protein